MRPLPCPHCGLLGVLLALAACAEHGGDPMAPAMQAAAFGADSLGTGPNLAAVTAAATPVGILTAQKATVTIIDTDCAATNSAVQVSGVFSETLWSDGCHSSGSRTLGPAPSSGAMFFSIHGIAARVSGAYPSYLVEMEDATDNDYNDVVCSVRIYCSYVSESVTDPLLSDPVVQQALEFLWQQSHGDDPLTANRFERGGYLVERSGEIEFVEYEYDRPASACRVRPDRSQDDRIEDNGGDVIAQMHTHVMSPGVNQNPGTCDWTGAQIEIVHDRPSVGDRNSLSSANDPGRVSIVLAQNSIYVMARTATGFDVIEVPRDNACRF